MNIPTANVIVSFSGDSMRSLFESGGSTKSLIKTLEESGDFLLFNKESNPNFISFEYTFGLGGGQHTATLKFLDPDNEFEDRFFTKGFAENIAGFKPAGNKVLLGHGSKNRLEMFPDVDHEDRLKPDAGVRDEFMKRYKDAYGKKHIYLSYGSGFNTDAWAGPYKMYLTGATIEGAKGKVITLKLTPTPQGLLPGDRRTSEGNDLNLHLNGLFTHTTGESEQLNIGLNPTSSERNRLQGAFDQVYEVYPYQDSPTFVRPWYMTRWGAVEEAYSKEAANSVIAQTEFFKTSQVIRSLGGIDFHDMIVDCIKDYIGKATGNKNVIVLLPNLNLLLLDFIEQETKKLPPRLFLPSRDPEVVKSLEFYTSIKNVIELLGFTLWTKPKGAAASISPIKAARHAALERPSDIFKEFLSNNVFSIGINTRSSNLIANHQKTLKAIMDKLSAAMMGRYPMNIVTFTENNDKWLRLWGENPVLANHRTFAGINHVMFQKNEEAIIFGDLGIIKSYLYATKDLVDTPEDPFDVPKIKDADKVYTSLGIKISEKEPLLDLSAVQAGEPGAVALSEELRDLKAKRQEAQFTRLNAFIAFAGTNILGPMDRSILDQAYQAQAREEILSKIYSLTETPFGNLYEAPDEFALDQSKLGKDKQSQTLEALQSEAAKNIFPIFKYNTPNANVLELKSDISLGYFVALQRGVEKAISRRAAGVVTGQLKSSHASLPVLTVEEAVKYLFANDFANGLDDKVRMLKELQKRVSLSLVEDYNLKEKDVADEITLRSFYLTEKDPTMAVTVAEPKTYNLQTIAIQIGAVASKMQLEGNSPIIMIDQEKPGDAVSYISTLLAQAYRRAFTVTLKTTPLFHLSIVGQGMLSNCLLFAQDPPVVKTGTRPNQNFFNNFLSGMYQIIGFKHKILSSGEASSEFSLIGGPVATTENSDA